VAASRMALRAVPSLAPLLLFTFIGQSRFDENRMPCQALGIAVGLSVELVKSGAAHRPLRHFGERPMDNPSPGVMPRPAL